LEIVQPRIIGGWTDFVQSRAHVIDTRNHRRESGDRIESGSGEYKRHRDNADSVNRHKGEHGENDVVGDRLPAELDRRRGVGVHRSYHLVEKLFVQQESPDHFDSSGGGARAAGEAA
jgi:hypothetical protein